MQYHDVVIRPGRNGFSEAFDQFSGQPHRPTKANNIVSAVDREY
jgi:hypothetical protein